MPNHWTVLLLSVCGVLLYAVVMPSVIMSNIEVTNSNQKVIVTLSSGHGRLAGSTAQLAGSTSSTSRRKLSQKEPRLRPQQVLTQQQKTGLTWVEFWGTDYERELRSMQRLKHTLDKIRYQRLTKDVEDQATAGLDLQMAEALARVSNATGLQETQAWLRREVTGAVMQALHDLQQPSNCSAVKKLYCDLGKSCGFGCQLHHVVHCFTISVALKRTMVVKVYPTNYIKTPTGWEDTLQPISSCSYAEVNSSSLPSFNHQNPQQHADAEMLMANIIDSGTSGFDPPAMPPDVHDVVQLFTTRPEIWWVGMLASYLLRPSAASLQRHAAFKAANVWAAAGPVVGVHIRRTDKLAAEAKLHQVDEYMQHVEYLCDMRLANGWQQRALKLWEDQQQQQQQQQMGLAAATAAGGSVTKTAAATVDAAATAAATAGASGVQASTGGRKQQHYECSVYLATDEPAAAKEVNERYKHIHIITNNKGLTTSSVAARYSSDGFVGVYDDVVYLSQCDYLVGTFSSQVSRLAYEVSLVNSTLGGADRTFAYHSVDSMWYFGGMTGFTRCAATDFTSQGRVTVKAGQKLRCATIHEFDGHSGHEMCTLYDSGAKLQLPPGFVVDCPAQESTYRSILPEYMQRPPPAAAAAAAAAAAEETLK
uniref:GT23 domain-containing protein n=1 Tax=Tetradesmus obliquus TaxID=3088 RepID=A0A383VNV2_TETOB|eukprot:jgi/Sobl393_1/16021/SZX66841.1